MQERIYTVFVEPNEDDPERLQVALIVRALLEFIIVLIFFSLALPIWNKIVASICTRISYLYHTDCTRDEINFERMMLLCNFMLDLIRFVFGRGVLFRLSSPWVFFFLIFKDLSYQFWHFGFKYCEEYVVFVIKVFHPQGRDNMGKLWRKIARFVEHFVKAAGIPRSIASNWNDVIDYNHNLSPGSKPGPSTNLQLSLTFCNMTITITNLPQQLA